MAPRGSFNRRAFLKSAGMTAVVGVASAGTSPVAAAAFEAPDGKYDFDTVYNRVGTDCTKWDRQIRTYGAGSIAVGMGIADMDFKAAPAITKALHERLEHENWGYLDMPRSFIDGIVAWNRRRYGVDIDPDSVVIAAGVHPALIAALQTFSPPGSKVLLQTPVYDGFYSDLTFARVKPEESLLKLVNGRYSMDFDDFERRISHDTNTFILCNPQNPTGNCWSAADLMKIGEICLTRRVVVLADEIHCDFVTKGHKYTPFASLPNKDIVNNSITFKAASKSFGLAAHKIGWFYSTNPALLARLKENHRADLSTLGIVANRAAYMDGEEWLNQLVDYIDGNHDFVERFIRANIPSIKYVKPEGTYLAWLDVSAVVDKIGAKALADEANRNKAVSPPAATPETMVERYFVKHAKVHMNQGPSYGLGGAGHMRMNIATSRKLVELALTNLASALRKA
ncbi:MAG: MalY/PatB family protein [Vicinamibacterales bacterium]